MVGGVDVESVVRELSGGIVRAISMTANLANFTDPIVLG